MATMAKEKSAVAAAIPASVPASRRVAGRPGIDHQLIAQWTQPLYVGWIRCYQKDWPKLLIC